MKDEPPPPSMFSFLHRLEKKIFHRPLRSSEALLQALKEAEENHIINSHSRLIIESSIQLENMKVRDIMVPKAKMVMINHNAPSKELLNTMIRSAHSRFPVINDNHKIQGIILAKDLLGFLADKKPTLNYKEYLRDAILVPESKTLGTLLRDFQQDKSHMAIVMDEYSEIAGLVTLEDVLEQIVGEIEDEHDLEENAIIDSGEGKFLLKADTSIKEFNNFFAVELIADGIDTVAGLVIAGFTRLPEEADEIALQGFNFKVLKSDSRKLHLLAVSKVNPADSLEV